MPDLDLLMLEHDLPSEFEGAPPWARLLYAQGRALSAKIGAEPDANGNNGSGLTGRVAEVERRLRPFESLKDKAWGAAAMAAILLAALWWMLQDRVATLLKLHA